MSFEQHTMFSVCNIRCWLKIAHAKHCVLFNMVEVDTGDACSTLRPRNLTDDGGTLASPNYPGNYSNGADCQWLITASTEPYGVSVLARAT